MFTFFSFFCSYLYVSSVCTVPTRQICCFDLQREGKKPAIGKRYFAGTLEEMIMDYHQKQMSIGERNKGLNTLLIDRVDLRPWLLFRQPDLPLKGNFISIFPKMKMPVSTLFQLIFH